MFFCTEVFNFFYVKGPYINPFVSAKIFSHLAEIAFNK